MGIKIVAHGYLGTLKRQEMSTNDYASTLSSILNSGGILAPVTIEKNKVFSYWGATIDSYDIGKYSINQLISMGFVTSDNILNIYANYSYMANNIQITLDANGGKFSDGSTTKILSKPVGTIYAELLDDIVALPRKDNITFYKWIDESGSTINGHSEFTKSTVLTANWVTPTNTRVNVRDSFGNMVKEGYSIWKQSMWKDVLPDIIKEYTPHFKAKALKDVIPGYGSFTGQKIKRVGFTNKVNAKIGHLHGTIADQIIDMVGSPEAELESSNNTEDLSHDISDTFRDPRLLSKKIFSIRVTVDIKKVLTAGDARAGFEMAFNAISGDGIPSDGSNKWHGAWLPLSASDIGKDIHKDIVWTSTEAKNFNHIYGNWSGGGLYAQRFTAEHIKISAPRFIVNKSISDYNNVLPMVTDTNFNIQGTIPNNPTPADSVLKSESSFSIKNEKGLRNYLVNSDQKPGTYTWSRWRPNGTGDSQPVINNGDIGIDDTDSFGSYLQSYSTHGDNSWLYGNLITIPLTAKKVSIRIRAALLENVTDGVPLAPYIIFYDANRNQIASSGYNIPLSDFTKVFKWYGVGNLSIPNNAYYVAMALGWNIPSIIAFGKGMISFTSGDYEHGDAKSIGSYVPKENNPGISFDNIPIYDYENLIWAPGILKYNGVQWLNHSLLFDDKFDVKYATGDLYKINDSNTIDVYTTIADYGSKSDSESIYPASYFPDDDNGITLNLEELLGYAYVEFNNPFTGYSEKVYKAVGTPFSEFLKSLNISNFQKNGQFLKGFFVKGYYNIAKLIATDRIQSNTTLAVAKYAEQSTSTFSNITLDANGGLFYPGTSNQTDKIRMNVQNDDTYSIISNFAPPMTKRTMSLLYWARNLKDMEPAYPFKVTNGDTIYSKWTVQGGTELKRKPREFYLIDADTIFNGWDMMDKYSISEKNNIFVIDPTGVGTAFSNDITSSLDGWGNTKRQIESNNIEFDAYYNGYDQYNKLGSWLRGKRLVLAMLNETNSPTYWGIQLENIERTEIKYGTDMLKGKLAFKKTSPAFDLEFIGIGTDNIIDNADDMFRRNAYVYIHSMKIPDVDTGIQIMANDGTKVVQDSVAVSLPTGSYFEYSTIPFKEAWRYGDSWTNMPNNLYNNIIDLVTSKSLKLGIGKWDITVSSSNKVTINSLKPNTIGYYKGKTIDSLGGIGPFTGIAIKEKEL